MRIELITDPDHLYGWDQLADDVNQPRAGPAMIAAWARHMMDRDAELRVWFAIEGTQVVGVLPLVAESMPRGRERLLPPAATFMYGSIPVADPRREREIAAALVGACTTASTLVDVVGLDAMPPDSPWTDAFNNALSGPRWVAVDPIRHISSYVDLKGGVEQWLGRRDSKFKREVRRRARIQEAEGFRLCSTSEPEEIVTRLPAVHSLYAQRQQERGGAGYRFDETMIAAIREVLTRAP
ncbi:MAG: hypothetical protein ABSG39_12885, partial [Acidimicrobiales bacterium]